MEGIYRRGCATVEPDRDLGKTYRDHLGDRDGLRRVDAGDSSTRQVVLRSLHRFFAGQNPRHYRIERRGRGFPLHRYLSADFDERHRYPVMVSMVSFLDGHGSHESVCVARIRVVSHVPRHT